MCPAMRKEYLQKVFSSPISNDAKLVACYLIGIQQQDEKLPSPKDVAQKLNLPLKKAFFCFQELLTGRIITGNPEDYALTLQESPMLQFLDTLNSNKKAPLRGPNDLPPVYVLVTRFQNLHDRYVKTEHPRKDTALAEMRALCRDFGIHVIEPAIKTFFESQIFCHYKHPSRDYISLQDFRKYLSRNAARPKNISSAHANDSSILVKT